MNHFNADMLRQGVQNVRSNFYNEEGYDNSVTPNQVRYLRILANQIGKDYLNRVEAELQKGLGVRKASALIDELIRVKNERTVEFQKISVGISLSSLKSGYYAVITDSNSIRFFRITNVDKVEEGIDKKWLNWIFVREQAGDNFFKVGSQNPALGYYRGNYQREMETIIKNPLESLKLYGKTIGKCGVCGRTLTNAVSRELGIGPECLKNVGGY